MKNLKLYQVDAFAEKRFQGNPAAVCPLSEWLDDSTLQAIAAENNLSETAFIVAKQDFYEIRWFTPAVEVDLCGHATLASAFIIFNKLGFEKDKINFYSPHSGALSVTRIDDMYYLDFPTDTLEVSLDTALVAKGIDSIPTALFRGKSDYIAVLEREEDVVNIIPDFTEIAALDARGLIVTAKGNSCDFVSRFFGPQCGVPEDPVTGSAHTSLIPYWSKVFGKNEFIAKQLSKRGGTLHCKHLDDRVIIGGKAVLYLEGEIFI